MIKSIVTLEAAAGSLLRAQCLDTAASLQPRCRAPTRPARERRRWHRPRLGSPEPAPRRTPLPHASAPKNQRLCLWEPLLLRTEIIQYFIVNLLILLHFCLLFLHHSHILYDHRSVESYFIQLHYVAILVFSKIMWPKISVTGLNVDEIQKSWNSDSVNGLRDNICFHV